MSGIKAEFQPIAEKAYKKLEEDRKPFLEKAKECAFFTLPRVLPKELKSYTNLDKAYSDMGSEGVNNLVSELMRILFPPHIPFFSFKVSTDYMRQLVEQNITDKERLEVQKAMDEEGRKVRKTLLSRNRAVLTEALEHLVIAGNVLLHYTGKGFKLFNLSEFVVKRDDQGTLLDVVTYEKHLYRALPIQLQERLFNIAAEKGEEIDEEDENISVDIYTHVKRFKGKLYVYQEFKEQFIEAPKAFDDVTCPFLPLRFTEISKESYGHSYVENHLRTFEEYNRECKNLSRFSNVASKIVFFGGVGLTKPQDFKNAKSGDLIKGKAEDIGTFNMNNKHSDMRVTMNNEERLERRLFRVFLLTHVRDAERVTATEIQEESRKARATLGKFYTTIANELQEKCVRIVYQDLLSKGSIAEILVEGQSELEITTGIDALGRNEEYTNLTTYLGTLQNTLGGAVIPMLKIENIAAIFASTLDINADDIVKTKEEIQSEQERNMAQQIATNVAPGYVQQQLGQQQEGA